MNRGSNTHTTLSKADGFSLIGLAIGLVVVSLLVTPLLAMYQVTVQDKKTSHNLSNLSKIKDNINFYVVHNGRYPLPASLLADPTSATYGTEALGTIESCDDWPTANGICRTVGADPILIGAVPFNALGINPDFAHDYWNMKILYAVTESQTSTYTTGAGRVEVQAFDTADNLVTVDNNIDMILVSHGQTNAGAYTQNGDLALDCPGAGNSTDRENCNFDGIFVLKSNNTAFPEIGSFSSVQGPRFYDDLTESQGSVPVDLWLQSLDNSDVALTFASRIGIGTENPQAKVHVMGNVRAVNVLSDNICNTGMTDCFNPIIIAGNEPQMNCDSNTLPGNQPVINLGNSRVYCASPVDSTGNALDGLAFQFPADNATPGFDGFGRIDCADSAALMTGIDANGDPICVLP